MSDSDKQRTPLQKKKLTEYYEEKRGMFMAQKKGYDVLRFIEHGNGCYISSVYVEGVILIQWLSERPMLRKQDLFILLHEIAKQMDLMHRSKGMPVYQYMNPYCMVLTDEKKVLFIDMQAESSEERLRKMQSRKIRERFLPKEDPFYQNSTVQTDFYGYGKTVQFILSTVKLTEPLTGREEKKLLNLINRCLTENKKKQFHSALALRKHLPEVKEEDLDKTQEDKKKSSKTKRLFVILIILLIVAAGVFVWKKDLLSKDGGNHVPENSEVSDAVNNEPIRNIELNKDFEASKGNADGSENVETQTYEELEKNTEHQNTEELQIQQLQQVLALEVLGRYEEAADLCEEVLVSLESISEKERLYEKSALLYLKTGNLDKACEILAFGMEELLPSDYLWQCYLDLLTNNGNVDDERKSTMVEEFLEAHPEYKTEENMKLLEARNFYQQDEKEKEKEKEQ